MLNLACASLHYAIPALDPGVVIGLNRTNLSIPPTSTVLGVLAIAIRAGALVPDGSPGFWEEAEREIMATRDELLARADHLLLNSRSSVAHRGAA